MRTAGTTVRIDSARLRLQPFTEQDITPAYTGWLNDPLTVRYSNQRFATHTHESGLAYLESFAASPNLFLSVRKRSDDAAVGTLTAYIAVPHATADMGILIGDHSIWGRGYGLEAWQTLLNWLLGVHGLRKVTAGAVDCNAAMLRIMEKSGMHSEGGRKRQELVDGVERDILYFARFRDA